MHVVINGSFWSQPTVGSGQYLHGLLRWLPHLAPHHRYTLLLPATDAALPPLPAGVGALVLRTPFDGRRRNLAKLWFEQVSVPRCARLLQAARPADPLVLHIPYFAPPLRAAVPTLATIPDVIPLVLPAYRGGPHIRAYMHLVSQAARSTDHLITFSDHSRADIARQLGVPITRITTTLLAAEERYTPLTSPQEARQAADAVAARYGVQQPFIYYVGGLDVRKNVVTLLRAAALLQRQGQLTATLAIAGRPLGRRDPRLFPDLAALTAELGLQAHVRHLDVPYADGPLLYRTCTLFAFPSHYEGFGLPPLEAMACGAPVLVSSASSLPEVVADAALCVAPDDVAGWAAALARLLNDANLRADLRARGLQRAARFAWRQVAAETLALYEQVAKEPPTAST